MAKTLSEFQAAVIGSVNVSVTASDEVQVTGVFQGQVVAQTLPNEWPAMLFFDPDSTNFIPVRDINALAQLMAEKPNLRFFKAVKGVLTT